MSVRDDIILPTASSFDHAIDIVLTLDPDAFTTVVEADIRARHDGDDKPLLDAFISAALRSEAVCDLWYSTLVRMKKSTELTIAAKSMDDKIARQKLERQRQFAKASDMHRHHLEWRVRSLRFLTGVEARLAEASHKQRFHFNAKLPSNVVMERNQMSERARALEVAIRLHQREQLSLNGEYGRKTKPTAADMTLWAVLDDELLFDNND